MTSFPKEIERLRRIVSGTEPAGLPQYIATPRLNQPYATGSLAPHLGIIETAGMSSGGVILPKVDVAKEPIKYMSGFIGLDEYLGKVLTAEFGSYDNDHWIDVLVSQHPKQALVTELAFLNSAIRQPKLEAELLDQFKTFLREPLLGAFVQAMGERDLPRVFLARQPILRAIRHVLLYAGEVKQTMPFPPHVAAPMLAHAFATRVGHFPEGGPDLWPGLNAGLAMELIQNFLFNQQEDVLARLDRYSRLWNDYGRRLQRTRLRASPDDLVKEAIGVERLDLFAVAFALLARALNWKVGENFSVDPYAGVGMDRATFDAALRVCAADEATLESELRRAPADWAMLPFERHPVLHLGGTVVILDQGYLLDRVTSGLYWIVLDHERDAYGEGAKELMVWSQAYSEMVEALAEDALRAVAPRLLTGAGGKTFYTEADIASAYGKGVQITDVAIDFGRGIGLFEVQKGQVSAETRHQAVVEKFISDTERMVLLKAKQLQGTADALLADEAPLTGYSATYKRQIFPVAVQGATYPVNPITDEYIAVNLKERRLLNGRDDPRLHPLAVVDIGELEMVEGLVESKGVGVLDVLEGWKKSPGYRWSFRNYLIEMYGPSWDQFRPKRMGGSFKDLTESLIPRLKVSPE
jgi:hypothetical protein